MSLHPFGQEHLSIEHRRRPEQGDVLSRDLPGSIVLQELLPMQRPQVQIHMLLVLYNASWKWTARTSTRMKNPCRTLLDNQNTDHKPGAAHSGRTTVTHGIAEATEKLSSMNLGGGRQAMMQPIPLPMKAGGWHGRSGMFFERSQFSRDPAEPEPFRGRLQDDLFSFVGFYNKQVPPCLMQLHSRYMVVFCGFL